MAIPPSARRVTMIPGTFACSTASIGWPSCCSMSLAVTPCVGAGADFPPDGCPVAEEEAHAVTNPRTSADSAARCIAEVMGIGPPYRLNRKQTPSGVLGAAHEQLARLAVGARDRKSTRLNSSHPSISY